MGKLMNDEKFLPISKTITINSLYRTKLGRLFLTEESYLHNLFKNPYDNKIIHKIDNKYLKEEKDHEKIEYVKSIPEAKLYRGLLLQGYLISPKFLMKLNQFHVREDDLFIATYPRSGTTWMEEIVSCIYNDNNFDLLNEKQLHHRVHHIEVGRPFGHHKWLKSLPSPRLLATHLPLTHCPQQLKDGKCKVIYVYRNPKDNCVSYHHFHETAAFLGKHLRDWNKFCHYYARGYLVYGSWFEHVKFWWKQSKKYPRHVLFISYEELLLNLPLSVKKIAAFIGREQSDSSAKLIADHCSFASMRNNKMVNREIIQVTDLLDQSKSKFFRKGIIGDWKNYFDDEQSKLFNDLIEEHFSDTDIKFIFHEKQIE